MAEVIASAVALPDPEDVVKRPTSNGLKRRQSDVADDIDGSSKRQRTSPGKTSPRSRSNSAAKEGGEVASSAARARSTSPTESKNGSASKPETSAEKDREGGGRRKTTVVKAPDEKQRSKRLFGALLGNLNRPSDRTSKRRAEIEQRKKAELQKQDDERLEDRQRRLERLAIQRKNEQLQVDERDMHIRHEHMLSTANFLQTKATPKLYYRPWDLLDDEEDLIERQLKEAQAQIDRELIEWETEKCRRLGITKDLLNMAPSTSAPCQAPQDTNDKVGNSTSPHEAFEDAAIAKSGPNKDEEMAAKNTNIQPEHESTTNDEISDRPVEKPECLAASPHNPNSVVDGGAAKQVSASGEVETKESEKQRKTEVNNGTSVDREQTEMTPSCGTRAALDGDAKDEKDELDDDGDHVVKGDEDDVIY